MQTRNTVIMAVVLVLLGAFVYFYEIRGREAREEAERQAELLLHFDVDQVERVAVTTDEGTVTAVKEGDGWSITEPVVTAADGEAIDALVDRLHEAKREREIVEAAEDLAPFGLDAPAVRVELGLSGGDTLALALGKDTPVGFNAYATAGDQTVVAVTRSLKSSLDKKLFDLRDRAVLRFAESAVRSIELERGDLRALLRRQPRSADGEQVEVSWAAERPFSGKADHDTVEDLLSALHEGKAVAFVLDAAPTPAQLADYGLDRPYARITLRTDDEATHTLLIGSESDDPAGRYAMRAGGSAVFVVGDDLLEDLPARAEQLRNKQVLAFDRERVAALEVAHGDDRLRLVRDDGDWRVQQPRELAADASAVSRLLSALEDLRAEGFWQGPPGAPALTVRIEAKPQAEAASASTDEDEAAPSGQDAAEQPAAGTQPTQATEPLTLAVGRTVQRVPLSKAGDKDAEPAPMRVVTVAGDDTVYLVPDEDLKDLFVDLFDVRRKTLVQFTQSDLTELDLQAGDDRWQLRKQDEEWRIGGGEAAPEEKVSDLLWDLNFLRMEGIAAEWQDAPPDMTPWGLQPPRYRIVARTDEGVAADVAIGTEVPSSGQEDSGRVWVTVAGQPGVFEVSASLADAAAALVEALQGR